MSRSSFPGHEITRVGRWHGNTHQAPSPPEQKNASSIHWSTPSDVLEHPNTPGSRHSLAIYLSDDSFQGLSNSLHRRGDFSQLGLVASSTPFVTGRPYTLFHESQIFSDGAVGICLESPNPFNITSSFPNLHPLSKPLQVTMSEGNMVHSLDALDAAGLMLDLVRKFNDSKALGDEKPLTYEDHFYLSLEQDSHDKLDNIQRIWKITSGDPSRGSISLEGDDSPPEGSTVKIQYSRSPKSLTSQHHLNIPHHPQLASTSSKIAPALTFLSLPIDTSIVSSLILPSTSDNTDEAEDGTFVLNNTFLATSENGCLRSLSTKTTRANGGKQQQEQDFMIHSPDIPESSL
ncbi:hypothetical protein ABKN59_008404 [Abortiporus biennis]